MCPDPVDRDRATCGMPAGERFGGERLRADLLERRHAVQVRQRAFIRGKELARGRECCDRLLTVGNQATRPLGERQLGAGALGCDHENGAGAVAEQNVRAGAGERSSNAGAEFAQPFEPRWCPNAQRRREPHDLRGGGMIGVEYARADCRRGGGAENGGADRIGPQEPAGVHAPKPSRQRARRQRRKPLVAQTAQLESGRVHYAVAPSRHEHLNDIF